MNFTTDSEWVVSARGNQWRRLNGKIIVVGENKNQSTYWMSIDGNIHSLKCKSLLSAMNIAESMTVPSDLFCADPFKYISKS